MALLPGLCSVTFRQLAADDVVGLAAAARLRAVEWGADVHAPPGDVATAQRLARRCADAGISCPSYGTYLFAGAADGRGMDDLDACLDVAEALGATTLRMWCRFGLEPDDATDEQRAAVAADIAAAADAAASRGLAVALEHHPGTLTLTAASTLDLLAEVDRPNVGSYWQPLPGAAPADALAALSAVLDVLAHVHVFSWRGDGTRLPLARGEALWPEALRLAVPPPGHDRGAYLEFVAGDDPAQLQADAATLLGWLPA